MTRFVLVLLGLLGACTSQPGVVMQPDTAAPVIAAWRSLGLPVADGCTPPRLVVTSGAAFTDLCWYPTCGTPPVAPCDDSCFAYQVPAVVVSLANDNAGTIDHELLHWLQWCNGLSMDHADPRIWGAGGILHQLGG